MRCHRFVQCFFSAILAAFPFFASPGESAERKTAEDPAVLRVYMSGNYLPLHGMRGQERIGIEAEIAEALAAAMGRRVEYVGRERVGMGSLDAVVLERVDIALNAITPTKERAERVDFTEPIAQVPLRIAVRRNFTVRSLKDLAGKKIALPRGLPETQLAGLNAKIVVYDSLKNAVKSTIEYQTDAVVAEQSVDLESLTNTFLTISDVKAGESPIAIAVPKGKKAEYDGILLRIADKLAPIREKWAHYWQRFLGVSVGKKTACALTETNELACFGDQEFLLTPPAGRFIGLSMGAEHACAIRDDLTVACWGKNDQGQAATKPGKFMRVTAGVDHTCGLMQGGSVTCWGGNKHGQSDAPTGKYQTVGVGDGFSCALGSDGRIVCWGRKFAAIPGDHFTGLAVGPMGVCGIPAKGKVVCWYADQKTPVDLSSIMSSMTVGFDIACGLERGNLLPKCFGAKLGYVPDVGFSQIEAGQSMACGVRDDTKAIECWGDIASDIHQMRAAGGVPWHMSRISRPQSPPVIAVCQEKKWKNIGLLHPERGLLALFDGNFDVKNSSWYLCSGKKSQPIDISTVCKEENVLAVTIPLTVKKVKPQKQKMDDAATYQELAAWDIPGLPGSLSLMLYHYDPLKAGITPEEMRAGEGQEIGTGALRECAGLVLKWRESPGEEELDIGGCLSGD